MNFKDWQPWYNRIVSTFGYSQAEDRRATEVLSSLLNGKAVPLARLRKLIENRPVLILGAGPSLEEDLKEISASGVLGRLILISADGATRAALHVAKTVPSIVTTDLDGWVRDLIQADRSGAIMVVHAHGDNVDMLERIVPKFHNKIGSTQVKSRPDVYNFGGFTDGDRAVFLAVEMGAKNIFLAGMDFGWEVGKYSKAKPRDLSVKRIKLKIGKELLEWLADRTSTPLYDITSMGEGITGFERITVKEILTVL